MGHRAVMHLLGARVSTSSSTPTLGSRRSGGRTGRTASSSATTPTASTTSRRSIPRTSTASGATSRVPPTRRSRSTAAGSTIGTRRRGIVSSIHDGQFDVAADGSFEIIAERDRAAPQLVAARAGCGVDLHPALLRAGRTRRRRPLVHIPLEISVIGTAPELPSAGETVRARHPPGEHVRPRPHPRYRSPARRADARGRAAAEPLPRAHGVEAGWLRGSRHREPDDPLRAGGRRGARDRRAVPAVPVGRHRALEPIPPDPRLQAPPRVAQPRAAHPGARRLIPCGGRGAGSRSVRTGSRPPGRTPARSSCG